MLKIKNLSAGYDGNLVLKGIDINIGENEIVALIGPNGAGKSTIIRSIFNLTNIYDGEIRFFNMDIKNLKTHDLIDLGISYVNQGRINFTDLTVRENLEIGVNQKKNPKKNLKMIYKKFPILYEKRNELAFSLSGGQQQILALGRALIRKPKLLLLDEPTLGLSPKLRKELFQTIKLLKNMGISILIVEHNAQKVIEMADKTYLLENGKIALSGGKEILENDKIKEIYLGKT